MTMERRILDGNGRLTMFLCVLVFLYDRYRTHSRTIYGSSTPLQRTPGIKSAKNDLIYEEQMLRVKFFESFITKRKMVCESVLYFAVIVLTAASLLNFFEKSFMVPLLLKFLLLWYISTYKFNFHYNLQKKHVLRDLVESPEIFFRLSYWMWLIPRIISSDRFRFVNPSIESNGMGEAVLLQITFLLCEMCYYYPCYYFYYKDPFNETNDIFESLKFTPRQDIFVLSTLLQWAIPHLLLNFFYMVALGTPKIPRWGKKAIDHVIDFDSKFFVPLLSRLLQCNAYISYAHVIWYYFYGNSTTAVLLCIAIGNYIAHNSAEHSLQLLLHKSMPREYYRPRFVRYFTLLHMRKHSKHYENHKCEHKSDKKITDDVSLLFSDIFEAMLDKTGATLIDIDLVLHHYSVVYCTVLHCTVRYGTVLYCTVLYCTVLCCTVLYCTVLCCTVLHRTLLYSTLLYSTLLYSTLLSCLVFCCIVLCFAVYHNTD